MTRSDNPDLAAHRLAEILACPVCGGSMRMTEVGSPQLACVAGHNFDIARTGYVNLLLASQRKSAKPGYSREMLGARRTLMAAGLFDPLRPPLVALSVATLAGRAGMRPAPFLDAGCGEGHLFSQLMSAVRSASGLSVEGVGFDIAKPGIEMASKLDRTIAWCVANATRRLPFKPGVFGVLLNVLSPLHAVEFRRVLSQDGILLKVVPSEGHLVELRTALYEAALPGPDTAEEARAQLSSLFTVVMEQRQSWVWRVGAVPMHDLLTMSPLFWKAKRARVEAVEREGLAQVTVDIEIIAARPR